MNVSKRVFWITIVAIVIAVAVAAWLIGSLQSAAASQAAMVPAPESAAAQVSVSSAE